MKSRTILFLAAACAWTLVAACGGDRSGEADAASAGETELGAGPADAGESGASLTSLPSGPIENGEPMPAAEHANGVPPYPNAIVWTLYERPPSEFHTLSAFTPDSFLQVVAFYDRALAGWRRTVAKDAVHYHQDPNRATLIVAPWIGEDIPPPAPEPLVPMRTSIGLAWKKGS